MISTSLIALAAASLVSAATPPGFQPAGQGALIISYGGIAAMNGAICQKECAYLRHSDENSTDANKQQRPKCRSIATEQSAPGHVRHHDDRQWTYDERASADNPLLHLAQTGFHSSPTPMVLNSTAGPKTVYVMQNLAQQPPLAEYIGPNPPARAPLAHRYAFVAVDHTQITQQGLSALSQATSERRGFDAVQALTAAGLQMNAVAGDYFIVRNTGPIRDGSGNGTVGGGQQQQQQRHRRSLGVVSARDSRRRDSRGSVSSSRYREVGARRTETDRSRDQRRTGLRAGWASWA
ncbi:conserved hypothetical protein [Verticillium alfalfae VaMs.102]|uniref:Phosphatidylethanolamine-binding protein n=1 Tax=Verticillium alfalfae (strain VaMs.102 / ATCC MYA-4576 / FGSC 10136) TaxID=526221 RepID=C9S8U5_VERA1|nr:conserved hypothetical protein [Verticillium alfalfae VaMs.102]EEY14022.1 conserved hypothetical protein [Verticillium alfalfae VaMs.102]